MHTYFQSCLTFKRQIDMAEQNHFPIQVNVKWPTTGSKVKDDGG